MAATSATTHHEHATTTPAPARRSGWSLFWGGVGFAVFLLVIGLLTLLAIGWKGEGSFTDVDTQREAYRAKVLADRIAEDHKMLYDAPSWLAKDKGIVRVPIDQAVAMTMTRLQTEKPHAAYPVSQSPPQPAAAPTSPGVGSSVTAPGNTAVNPPASNPTAGQTAASTPAPSPAPSAAPATAKSSPPPGGIPIPGVTGASAPAASPNPGATPVPTAAPTPAHTGEPAPGATPMPTAGPGPQSSGTPAATPNPSPTPAVGNNANNPGNPPIPGTTVQPPAPSPTIAPLPTPNGATAQPENSVRPPPKPSPSVSGSPDPNQTTASPAP